MSGIDRPRSSTLVCRLSRLALVAAGVWIALLATAIPANAHPVLLFTDPAQDGAVTDSPPSVTLRFNEAVTIGARAITVTDPRDREVTVGEARTAKDGIVVTAPVEDELSPGTYVVRWEATGVDGHGVGDEFRFAVGTAITGAAVTSGGQDTDWRVAGARWLLLAGFALAFGGLIGERITATARAANPALSRVYPWSTYGAAVGLTASLAAGALLSADVGWSSLWESSPGRVVLADAAGFILALGLLATRWRLCALLPLAAVPVAEGFGSHSNVELPIAGAALTGVHLVAAAVWAGALLHVTRAAIRWRATRAAVQWVLAAYARMAAWVFVIVVATGLTMAQVLVPIATLTTTAYGKTLLVKLTLVAAATGLALTGRWALRRQRLGRLRRSVTAEAATLVAVLIAAAVLVSTPTPAGVATAAPPPPPPRGVAVPAGGLAGQVGVNMVASDGQVVIRLSTPLRGEYYGPRVSPEYEVSGQLQAQTGATAQLRFRPCGGGCFVAPVTWAEGNNVLSVRAGASGWRGGTVAAVIPWPAQPAGELVQRTVRIMRDVGEFTVYEASTSDTSAGFPEAQPLRVGGELFLSNEPYNSGVAPIAAEVRGESGSVRLLMGFPAALVHAEVTLDGLGRISEETLTGPKHMFKRSFLYPDQQ